MSQTESGTVVDVIDDFLVVEPLRREACEHCEIKELCMGNSEGKLKIKNISGQRVKKGNVIEFEVKISSLNNSLITISLFGIGAIMGGATFGYFLNPFGIDASASAIIFSFLFTLINMIFFIVFGRKEDDLPVFKKIVIAGGENEHNK